MKKTVPPLQSQRGKRMRGAINRKIEQTTRAVFRLALGGLLVVLAQSAASAHAEEAGGDPYAAPYASAMTAVNPPPRHARLKVSMGVGLWHPLGSDVRRVYENTAMRYQAALDIRGSSRADLTIALRFTQMEGIGLGRYSQLESEDTLQLRLIPLDLGPTLRLGLDPESTVEPFLGAFGTYAFLEEKIGDTPIIGGRLGWGMRAGLAIRVDGGPAPGWTLDASRALKGTWIQIETRYASYGTDTEIPFQLGGVSLGAGLSAEF